MDKEKVSLDALLLKDTFFEQEFTVKVYRDEEEEDDLVPEDEGEPKESDSPPPSSKEKFELLTYTKLVTRMQPLTFRPVRLSDEQTLVLRKLIHIAEATNKLIDAEVSVESDEYCDELRRNLNRCYDNFIELHGKIENYYSWFADRNSFWVDYRLIQYALTLENKAGQKVDLFYRRQSRPRTIPIGQIFFDEKESDRIIRAFWWCRSYFNNQVILSQIAEKSGSNAETVEDVLLSHSLVDRVPVKSKSKPTFIITEKGEEDNNLEVMRNQLEKQWNSDNSPPTLPSKNNPRSITSYSITMRNGSISTVEGIVGELKYLAVTTRDPSKKVKKGQERYTLVHLNTGMKVYDFKSLDDAIACMDECESNKTLTNLFEEKNTTNMTLRRYPKEFKILTDIIAQHK